MFLEPKTKNIKNANTQTSIKCMYMVLRICDKEIRDLNAKMKIKIEIAFGAL